MANRLQIIPSRLLIAVVGVNATVSSGAGELLASDKWDMLSIRILIGFSKAKVDDEDGVFVLLG